MPHRQQLSFVKRHNIFPIDQHLAGIRLEQCDQVLEEHALATAAPADNHHRLPFVDAKADTIQHDVRAELLRQIAHLDHKVWKIFPSVSVRKKFVIRMVMEE